MSDTGGTATEAIVDEIAKVRTIKEESPKASSGSSGVLEQSVQGLLRVMKCALEAPWRKGIPDEHPALACMADYAVLLNPCEVGKDGRMAFERSEGKKAKLSGIGFGETVPFRRHRWAAGDAGG